MDQEKLELFHQHLSNAKTIFEFSNSNMISHTISYLVNLCVDEGVHLDVYESVVLHSLQILKHKKHKGN